MDPQGPTTKIRVDRKFHLCGSHGVSRTTCYSLKGLGGPCAPCPIAAMGACRTAEALELDPYTGTGDWIHVTQESPDRFLCERQALPATATRAISNWRDRNLLQGLVVEQAANKVQAILLATAVLRRHVPSDSVASRFVEQLWKDTEELARLLGLTPR